jgi:hypothetical protein
VRRTPGRQDGGDEEELMPSELELDEETFLSIMVNQLQHHLFRK